MKNLPVRWMMIGLVALAGAIGLVACRPAPISPIVTVTTIPSTAIVPPTPTPFPFPDRVYLGMYSVFPTDMRRVAQAGLNVVSVPPGSVEEMLVYLDAAEGLGLRVRLSLSPSFLDAAENRVIAYVEALASNETIVMWYLPEEPKTEEDHERWKALYDLVKAHDSAGRPIGLYLARGATEEYFLKWADTCDIFMAGAYPEYYDIPRASIFTRVKSASLAAAKHGMRTISVPQFFDLDVIVAVKGKNFAKADSRLRSGHPDAREFRADAYASLIAGAGGLDWYSLKYAASLPDLWDAMAATVDELNCLGPILAQAVPGPTVTVTVLSGPEVVSTYGSITENSIQVRAYRDDGNIYLLTVNLADEFVETRFEGLPVGIDEAEVVFENRTVSVNGGTIEDSFLAHGVHVYQAAQ